MAQWWCCCGCCADYYYYYCYCWNWYDLRGSLPFGKNLPTIAPGKDRRCWQLQEVPIAWAGGVDRLSGPFIARAAAPAFVFTAGVISALFWQGYCRPHGTPDCEKKGHCCCCCRRTPPLRENLKILKEESTNTSSLASRSWLVTGIRLLVLAAASVREVSEYKRDNLLSRSPNI